MPAPTLVYGAVSKANGDVTPALPAHVSGDYLILVVHSDGTGASNSLSGAEAADYTPALVAISSTSNVAGVYFKEATSGSHAAITATATSEEQAAFYIVASGLSTDPTAATATDSAGTNSTIDCPTITGPTNPAIALRGANSGSASSTISGRPPGTFSIDDVTNGAAGQGTRFGMVEESVAGAATPAAVTYTFSLTNVMCAYTVLLEGTAGGGPTSASRLTRPKLTNPLPTNPSLV